MVAKLERVHWLHPDQIKPGPFRFRKGEDKNAQRKLVDAVSRDGIREPLTVRAKNAGEGYELLAGERRWRAAVELGLNEVPVMVKDMLTDRQAITIGLADNVRQQTLDVFEEGEGYARLMSTGMGELAIAKSLGVDVPRVQLAVSMLQLDQPSRDQLFEGFDSPKNAELRLAGVFGH